MAHSISYFLYLITKEKIPKDKLLAQCCDFILEQSI